MIPEDKADLIIEILHQHEKRFDQIENQRKDDKIEMHQRFKQMEVQRKDDKIEMHQRFEQIERRFEQMDRRFEQLVDLIREEKHEREKYEEKLQKVYESRDRVTVNFTRSWATASFFIALIASTIVLAVAKAF